MTISDLSSGLPAYRDDLLATAPADPLVRQGVSMWITDDEGRISLPRVALEAIGSDWSSRGVQANIVVGDRVFDGGRASPADDGDDPVTTFGSSDLTFACAEPFERWTMRYDAAPLETTLAGQVERSPGQRTPVRIEVEATMCVPAFVQGALSATAADLLDDVQGLLMGGVRHEQLFRCSGTVQVGESAPVDFTGTGLRIHRIGVRDIDQFWGHIWQSAVFPSGKAFGVIAYPPRDDLVAYNEGFVFDGERMAFAEATSAPWLHSFGGEGQDVGLTLATSETSHVIDGAAWGATFHPSGTRMFGDWKAEPHGVPFPFQQGSATYRWDGEEANGMIERSLPGALVDLDDKRSAPTSGATT